MLPKTELHRRVGVVLSYGHGCPRSVTKVPVHQHVFYHASSRHDARRSQRPDEESHALFW